MDRDDERRVEGGGIFRDDAVTASGLKLAALGDVFAAEKAG